MVFSLRTGVENSAIRKCTYLYYDVDHAQEMHDVDCGWPVGITWLVTDFGGGGRGEPPAGGDRRGDARGGRSPGARASARADAYVSFKREEVAICDSKWLP